MAKTVVESKGWLKSFTIGFNALVGLAVVGDEIVEAMTASGLIPDIVTKWLLLIFALVNIGLRIKTKQPLAATPIQNDAAQVPAPPTYTAHASIQVP